MTRWLARLGIAAVLLYGVALRVAHPTRAMAWFDEILTSLHTSGHSMDDATAVMLASPTPLTAAELQQRLLISDHGIVADLRSAITFEPSAGPAYYLCVRVANALGDDPMFAARAVAAGAAVLVLPCMFFLCLELFGTRRAAWLGACFAAVSPQQLYLAFDSRFYSLWACAICVASTLLLRALRRDDHRAWIAYAIAAGVMMNCHLVSVAVLAAHTVTAALSARRARSLRLAIHFALAATGAMIMMLPWLVTLWQRRVQFADMSHWLSAPISRAALISNLRHFLVGNLFTTYDGWDDVGYLGSRIVPLIAALLVVALVELWRRGTREQRTFAIALLLAAPLFLAAQDITFGGQRLAITRYLVPTMLALLLLICHLATLERTGRARVATIAGIVVLLALGSISSWHVASSRVPEGKPDTVMVPIADAITDAGAPLVVVPGYVFAPLVLANLVDPRTEFVFLRGPTDLDRIPHRPFLVLDAGAAYEPRLAGVPAIIKALRARYALTEVVHGLWH